MHVIPHLTTAHHNMGYTSASLLCFTPRQICVPDHLLCLDTMPAVHVLTAFIPGW